MWHYISRMWRSRRRGGDNPRQSFEATATTNSNSSHPSMEFSSSKRSSSTPVYFDIWPINLFSFLDTNVGGDGSSSVYQLDRTGLFLLQLACLVARSPFWRKRRYPPRLRVFFPVLASSQSDHSEGGGSLHGAATPHAMEFRYSTTSSSAHTASVWLEKLLSDLRIQVG